MIKEEWRMHSTLFGGRKFALFPLLIALLSLATVSALSFVGIKTQQLQLGIHYLLLFVGLSVGSIGFISESGIENVLGDTNFLLFSSRTLPVSTLHILTAFFLKDIIYYFSLFILPLAIGNLLLSPALLPLLLLTYLLSFLTGLSLTFMLSAVYTRIGKHIILGLLLLLILAGTTDMLAFSHLNPALLFYLTPSWTTIITAVAIPALLITVGGLLFDRFTEPGSSSHTNRFTSYTKRLGPLNAKNILDLQRSSGGLGKLLFSMLALVAVYWFIRSTTPLSQLFQHSSLLVLGTLLGIFSLSVYNWLTRFDSEATYEMLPLDDTMVLTGKIKSYFLLGLPLVLGTDIIAAVLLQSTIPALIHTLLITAITSSYVLAITIKLTGRQPNTLLFNPGVMARFLILNGVLLVPFLVTSLYYAINPLHASIGLLILYILAGTIAYRILASRWER